MSKVGMSTLSFHMGRALVDYIANRYPFVKDSVYEYVQNAIDGGATMIVVTIDRKRRTYAIADNGNGVSRSRFDNEVLQSICSSIKTAEQMGQFGIGLISGLGKGDTMVFTSCPKSGVNGYHEWTFNSQEIREQESDVQISNRPVPNTVHESYLQRHDRPSGAKVVPWRTKVEIRGYSKDRRIGFIPNAETLFREVEERFGAAMRRNRTKISITVRDADGSIDVKEGFAGAFKGIPLPSVTITIGKDRASFNLYIAKKKGRVRFGEEDNDFRFTSEDFLRSVHGALSRPVVEAVSSGFFEGEILSSGAKLDAGRKSFVDDEGLENLLHAMERWWKQHGKEHYDAEQEKQEDVLLQDLGRKSLQNVADLLKNEKFKPLFEPLIESFKRGTAGRDHAAVPKQSVIGKQEEKSVAIEGVKADGGGDGGDSEKPRKEPNPAHHPFTVAGPKGHRRTLVKNDSLGLQLSHAVLEGQTKPWEFDVKNGIIYINTRHPEWVACQRDTRAWMQLQEQIILLALLEQSAPEGDFRSAVEYMVQEYYPMLSFLVRMSSSFTGRKRSD